MESKENSKDLGTTTTNEFQTKKDQKKTKGKSFNWDKYLNPKHDEFFKEGNYSPPAPFMELARNPNDQNIKNWISYNKKKNELNTRLQRRMKEYLSKNAHSISEYPKTVALFNSKKRDFIPKFDPARFRVRMYFSSTCPHCKRMFKTLEELQAQGIFVEAHQTDDKLFRPQYSLPTVKASKEDIKKHQISSVPFTLIADLKKKVLYPPVRGFQDTNQIIKLLKEAQNL